MTPDGPLSAFDRWSGTTTSWSAPLPAPAQVAFGGIDADRDGFFSNQDCNDNNATIRPNAQELRGNRIDENCDGRADDFLAITSPLGWSWSVRGTRVTINRLNASNVPADVTIEFRCTGKRCPLKRIKAAKPRNGRVNILTAIRAHRTRFRAGQTLEVRITAPDRIGKSCDSGSNGGAFQAPRRSACGPAQAARRAAGPE